MTASSQIAAIMPVYNGAAYIEPALASIVNQTHPLQAIVVVDDGSTDATREVVQNFARQLATRASAPALRYHYQHNQGMSVAINHGVEQALREFPATNMLAFLDADDLWTETKLEQQLRLFEQDAALEAVFGETRQFYSDDTPNASKTAHVYRDQVRARHLSAMLIRRDAWQRVGYLDPAHKIGFFQWLSRAEQVNLRIGFVDDVVTLRRIHGSNMSIRERAAIHSDYFQILKSHLDRKRTET